jgi:hypothetical protein
MKERYWMLRYNLNHFRRTRSEAFWRSLASHTPTEWKRWVLVHCAVRAMGADKGPDAGTYETMCKALDRRAATH